MYDRLFEIALPGGVLLTYLLIPAARWWLGKEFKQYTKAIDTRIAELATEMQTWMGRAQINSDKIIELQTKVGVFWKMIETNTATMLHRDDTPHIDYLLEKLPSENLTVGERRELERYLLQIENSQERPPNDRVAALVLRASLIAQYPEDFGYDLHH